MQPYTIVVALTNGQTTRHRLYYLEARTAESACAAVMGDPAGADEVAEIVVVMFGYANWIKGVSSPTLEVRQQRR